MINRFLKVVFVVLFLLSFCLLGISQNLEEQLKNIPGIVSVVRMNPNPFFKEAFMIMVKQPIDHLHPEKGTFPQRVILSNLDIDKPIVYITEGYGGDYGESEKYLNELCPILNANQLFVEHRFFGKSVPDSIDWNYMTVENAAADHHHIVELFKQLYKNKWISTGISKGGETVLYHRALYPRDVDISVPYVAPLNFSVEEKRHDRFIRHKAGTASDRESLRECQIEFLKRKSRLMPLFEQLCKDKKYNFRAPANLIYDYCVLEFAFSFWQWGYPVSTIPASTATDKEFFNYLIKICSPDYFDTESGKPTFPFFVQALKQLGYYGYNPKPFGKLMELSDTHNYIMKLFMPSSYKFLYDPSMSLLVKKYLKKNADKILFIYGENDPWSASAASTRGNRKILKVVQPGGSHRSRIGTMPEAQNKLVIKTLKAWMN
ncbi:MAG: S28 family serine protease [Mariniphaga sp.]